MSDDVSEDGSSEESWVQRTIKRVGKGSPIRELIKLKRHPMDFPLHVWGARISEGLEATLPETTGRLVASGISDKREEAIAAACGEALERYTFALLHETLEDTPTARSSSNFSSELIFNLPFLLPKDISRKAWCEEALRQPCRTMQAWRYNENGKRQKTSLPVEFITQDGRHTLFSTTNGMATGTDFERAVMRGLNEVVERDALMLVWLCQVPGTRVDPKEVLSTRYVEQIDRMEEQGVEISLQEVSTDLGFHAVLAVSGHFPEGEQPLFAFGAGADMDRRSAAVHAYQEACLGWKGTSLRVLSEPWSSTTSENNGAMPESFVEHADFYACPENLHHVSFLFDPNDAADREIPHGGPNYLSLDARLRRLNREIYVLNLTPPDVRELGAYVVKVVVPGLVPFTVGDQRCDELAASRLPTTIGRETISDGREFNRLPHPWP